MTYCSYKINNHVKLDLKQEVSPASYFHLSSKIRQKKKTSLIKILLTIITQNALLPVVYAILLLDHQQGDVIIKRV